MKRIFLLCVLLFFATGFAQFSKTHYIPPLSGTDNLGGRIREQFLYISTPSVTPVNFKIIQLGGSTILGTVSRDIPYVYDIGFGTSTQLHVSESQVNTIRSDKGYVVEAEDMIYVTVRVLAGEILPPIPSVGNHAGEIVSKGLAALGTQFRIGAFNSIEAVGGNYSDNHYAFVAVLATENNTLVQFEDIRPGVELINNAAAGSNPAWITLNAGESFVMAVKGPHDPNRDGLIGTLVNSDKPIAVNCGSFAGSNGTQNLDLGFDQIVSAERTGKEYVFIKSTGEDIVERVLLVANEDNTDVFLNGSTFVDYTLNAGDYIELDGSDYNANGNMYVQTSKNVFAYQSIGDNSSPSGSYPNQEMFFVPPLNCETPHVIDNIPFIERIGPRIFTGRVTIVTETGSPLNFNIDGIAYSLGALAFEPGITIVGPTSVVGNPNFETYTITGLSGNVAVFSTSQLYLASYGSNANATFGGYYSGFTFKPEISFTPLDVTQISCIPNTMLAVNTLSAFDVFQWYFNGVDIPGAITSSYNPTQPGYYYVKATIANCGTTLTSDEIPISSCPSDSDNDTVNDNTDLDLDQDGIANCTESYGDFLFNLTNLSATGNISRGAYTNTFTPMVTSSGTAPGILAGNADGLYSEIPIGKGNSAEMKLIFAQPVSLKVQYVSSPSFMPYLMNANADYVLKCSISKTITVRNPNNQLLIDTNYDGIYESGITEYSSFEIRFRRNGDIPLAEGSGTFSFDTYLTSELTYKITNLSDTGLAHGAFEILATCLPKDTDLDGIPDHLDADSDNDGIADNIESQGAGFIAPTTADANLDGLADVYGTGIVPIDTDTDGVPDYMDLDSDNDGIYDLVESGSGATDNNHNGIVDGLPAAFGSNGLADSLETAPDSGALSYTIADSDTDNIANYLESDSDNDGCFDTIEAGFTDADSNGILGNVPAVVNTAGVVTSASGYTPPVNLNYTIGAPIVINTQPQPAFVCDTKDTTLTIANDPVDSYKWQVYSGVAWTDITDNATYSGSTTNTLQISGATLALDGLKYRVVLERIGNTCKLISDETMLTVYALPVITTPISLIQCDEDGNSNAITDVNLRQKEDFISVNYLSETFTYYTTELAAETADANFKILVPTAYNTGSGSVWVRVENANLCHLVARLNISVTATNISPTFERVFRNCDDYFDSANDDNDGIATFDFSSVTADILALLPSPSSGYSIKYYRNAADAAAETDPAGNSLEITDIANYRNIGYRDMQQVYVRVESNIDNACFGLGPYVRLIVDPLPPIAMNGIGLICENLPSRFITLDAGLGSADPTPYTYEWSFGGSVIPTATSYTYDVNTQGIYTVKVTSAFGCHRTRTITVDASDIAHIQNIEIVDFADVNTIAVVANGSGYYVYSLDYADTFQELPYFYDVAPGVHEIYVKDLKGCGIVGPVSAYVLGAPAYFTPNGDGYNDTWNLKGANADYNRNAKILIFDRYGKLLKQISPLGAGWDGTFSDKAMPGDDYWYTITLEDGRTVKGHFALKR